MTYLLCGLSAFDPVDQYSQISHQLAGQKEVASTEGGLDMVGSLRQTAVNDLGRVNKSFHGRSADPSVYDRMSGTDLYIKSLGPPAVVSKAFVKSGFLIGEPSNDISSG